MFLNVMFCLTKSTKPKDILFTIIEHERKQKILTFKELSFYIFLKNDSK